MEIRIIHCSPSFVIILVIINQNPTYNRKLIGMVRREGIEGIVHSESSL
jgi:hypothetical protein